MFNPEILVWFMRQWNIYCHAIIKHSCYYCGVKLTKARNKNKRKIPNWKQLLTTMRSRDHIVPIAKGGEKRKAIGVTVWSCYDCNQQKSTLSMEEYRIVHFGGHLGVFHGERIYRELGEILKIAFPQFDALPYKDEVLSSYIRRATEEGFAANPDRPETDGAGSSSGYNPETIGATERIGSYQPQTQAAL